MAANKASLAAAAVQSKVMKGSPTPTTYVLFHPSLRGDMRYKPINVRVIRPSIALSRSTQPVRPCAVRSAPTPTVLTSATDCLRTLMTIVRWGFVAFAAASPDDADGQSAAAAILSKFYDTPPPRSTRQEAQSGSDRSCVEAAAVKGDCNK